MVNKMTLSQRTYKLMTSPIKLTPFIFLDASQSGHSSKEYHSNSCNNDRQLSNLGIPDMSDVLKKFGILENHLTYVPLKHYKWHTFNSTRTSPPSSPTISQKIGNLIRNARDNPVYTGGTNP